MSRQLSGMRWPRIALMLLNLLRLVRLYVSGAASTSASPGRPSKAVQKAAEAAAIHKHLSKDALHVPPLRVGRPPADSGRSESYRATGGKCPKCEWKSKKFPKDSSSYYYHYGSHGTFDNGTLEWRSKDGRSLCRNVDKALIQRLMEEARRGGSRIGASQSIFGYVSQQVRAAGGFFTTTHAGTIHVAAMHVRMHTCARPSTHACVTAGEDGENEDSSAQASVNAAEPPTSDGTRESTPSAPSLSATTAGPQPVPSTSNADKGQGSSTRPHLSQPQRPAASSQAGPPPTPDVAPPGPPAAADEEQPEFQPAPENWIEDAGCTRKHTHMCTWPHTCSRTWPLTCAQACSHVCMHISIGMPTHARAHVAVV